MNDRLRVFAGPANPRLGVAVCERLGIAPAGYECHRFPDGEIEIALTGSVRGRDVYILQATSPPVEQHVFELLMLADACRRAGAARLTGVMPYVGYARQERRSVRGSLGARVAAAVVETSRVERLILVDAHSSTLEACFDVPVDHLTAVPLLAGAAAPHLPPESVVVAPDLGAVRRARDFARILRLPMAFVHKTRTSGEEVAAHGVTGNVQGRVPFIVDDMLSTGGTIEAAAGALRAAGAREPLVVAVTHLLLAGRAREVLAGLPLARVLATDSVEVDAGPPPLEVATIAALLADAIRRHHRDEPLVDLRGRA